MTAAILCTLFLVFGSLQQERYELGRRVKQFERKWEKQEESGRKAVVGLIDKAVRSFFSFRIREATRKIDQARLQLESGESPSFSRIYAASLLISPEKRFLDRSDKLRIEVLPFYPVEEGAVEKLDMVLSLPEASLSKRFSFSSLPVQEELSLDGLPEGDYSLVCHIYKGETLLSSQDQVISVVERLQDRIDLSERKIEQFSSTDTDFRSARSTLKILSSLAKGKTLETDYPAARLLSEVEEILEGAEAKASFYGNRKVGQFWLTLSSGARVRLNAPPEVKEGKPLPLVVALHGTGGSENMFFDTYGDGAVVRLSQKRGWLLVAPKSGMFRRSLALDKIIADVEKLYPVDRKHVFLIGHSSGAGQALSAAVHHPDLISGVAAISGGRVPGNCEKVRKIPFFLSAGAEDFGLRMTREASERLIHGGVERVVLKIYPNTEHLLVVQASLSDVFSFFDGILSSS